MDLVEQTYRLTETFPRHEQFGLASQMQRAAVSVPSDLAEGHTRGHTREYLQHISIAQGSLAELQTQLEIAVRLSYLLDEAAAPVLTQMMALAKQLYMLRNSLARAGTSNLQPPTPNPASGA
jgi:four helix bundle protein